MTNLNIVRPLHRHLGRRSGARNWSDALIAATVAVAGIDRIDLLRGGGAFVLTPFLILGPITVAVAVIGWIRVGSKTTTPDEYRRRAGGWLIAFFCGFAMLSVTFSQTPRSVPRFLQLMLVVTAGWALIYLVKRFDGWRALSFGAVVGLCLFVVFDVIQWRTFQQYGLFPPEYAGFLNLAVNPYGNGVIRFSGGSIDANRAAVAIATYAYILIGDPLAPRRRILPTVLILLLCTGLALGTISRSGLGAYAIVLVGSLGQLWRRSSGKQRAGLLGLLAVAFVWVLQSGLIARLNVNSIATSRLDFSSGSASAHFDLVGIGLTTISAAPPLQLFFGRGYGSAYLYLQDVFPNNPYGNYHSFYLTTIIETGLIAGLIAATLLIVPMFWSRRWLAFGAAVFGIFYQGIADPIFWIQIAMLWALPSMSADDRDDDEARRARTARAARARTGRTATATATARTGHAGVAARDTR